MKQASGIVFQVLQSVLAVLIAPLVLGWVNQCRAWLQNKSGAGIWQPYKVLNKLFHKDAVLAHNASPLFRSTPYILFGCMWLAVGIVPVLATSLPFAPAADVIALVGLFALARVFGSREGGQFLTLHLMQCQELTPCVRRGRRDNSITPPMDTDKIKSN